MLVSSLAGEEHGAVMLVARPSTTPCRPAGPGRRRQTPAMASELGPVIEALYKGERDRAGELADEAGR